MSVTAENILTELQQLVKDLKNVDEVKYIMDNFMNNEKEELKQLYYSEVAHLPRDDPVHISIVNILYFLGINPFDSVKMKDLLNDNIHDCGETLNQLTFNDINYESKQN